MPKESSAKALSRYDNFIPASDYTDPDIGRREREKLWPRVWQLAAREEEVPNVGDYVKYDIAGETIVVVRVSEDRISAYYNTCQHRGRQLVDAPRGNVGSGFFCRYHGWRYTLDGALSHVHHQEDWPECPVFSDGTLNLKQPQVGFWAGWIWINMDPDAPALEDYLGEVQDNLRPLEIDDMRLYWYETLIVDVNWKVVIEAFNEGYHVATAHNSLYDYRNLHNVGTAHGLHAGFSSSQGGSRFKDADGQWKHTSGLVDQMYRSKLQLGTEMNALAPAHIIRAHERLIEEFPEEAGADVVLPRMFALYREELEATGAKWPESLTLDNMKAIKSDWHIFPNTILLPVIDGLIWYRMRPHPDDDQKCVFNIWCLRRFPAGQEPEVHEHISGSLEEFEGRNTFLEQDFSNLRGVQRGMRSRGWQGAFTNPQEELPIAHFHRMLHDYIDG